MMKIRFFTLSALIVAAASCSTELVPETEGEFTVISVNLAETKTTLGPSAEGKRKVYWTDGDRMSLNGTASNPLSGVAPEAESADFVFRASYRPLTICCTRHLSTRTHPPLRCPQARLSPRER